MRWKKTDLDPDLCRHIFSASAGMVGVCLTVISLLRIVITLRNVDTLADDFVAFDALLFLIAFFSSYFALRASTRQRMLRVERIADVTFTLAICGMVFVAIFITYAIATVTTKA